VFVSSSPSLTPSLYNSSAPITLPSIVSSLAPSSRPLVVSTQSPSIISLPLSSNFPSIVSSQSPSLISSTLPSLSASSSPTIFPSVQSVAPSLNHQLISSHWVICGRWQYCSSNSQQILSTIVTTGKADVTLSDEEMSSEIIEGIENSLVSDSEFHEVRCCSDMLRPGWSKRWWCDVWARSALDGQCHKSKTFIEASLICAENGGRLCSKQELENNCAAGTGCRHDFEFIWTNTPGHLTQAPTSGPSSKPSVHPSFSVAPSLAPSISLSPSSTRLPSLLPSLSNYPSEVVSSFYYGICGRKDKCNSEEGVFSVDTLHGVRCCANTQIDSTYRKWEWCDVWASSYFDGQCLDPMNHAEAAKICSIIGARLCTVQELKLNCAALSGCGYDNHIVWTSTPGEPKNQIGEEKE